MKFVQTYGHSLTEQAVDPYSCFWLIHDLFSLVMSKNTEEYPSQVLRAQKDHQSKTERDSVYGRSSLTEKLEPHMISYWNNSLIIQLDDN